MPHCEHWILIQQKLDVLVAFSNSVLHVSVQPEFMFWTSELVSRDINFVSIFIQFVCPYLCSVFQFEVKDFCGLTPMHIWLLEVAKVYCVFTFFDWTSRNLFGLTYIIRIPSILQLCMATPRPAMYGRYHVYPLSGFGCGISTSSWSAAVTFCASLMTYTLWAVILIWEQTQLTCAEMWLLRRCTLSEPNFQSSPGGRYPQTPLQVHASYPAH